MITAAAPATSLAQRASLSQDVPAPSVAQRAPAALLQLTSEAFSANQAIPSEYTCDGARIAPPLAWTKAPASARSIAVLMEEPDRPGGADLHWLVTGIAPDSTSMPASMLPPGASTAKNDKGQKAYQAPCETDAGHRYVFHVYALDTALPADVTKEMFFGKIEGHVLAHGTLAGTYGKHDQSRTVGDVTSGAGSRKTGKTPVARS